MKRITVFLLNLIVLLGITTLYCQMSHAQQLKMGKNLNHLRPNVLLDLEDTGQALLLTRVKDPNTVIGRNSYRGMIVFDSAVNKLTYYDGTAWVYPITSVSSDTSLYKYDGILASNRRVDLNGKSLSFSNGTSDSLYLTNGKVGISINPQSALHVKGAVRTDSLVLNQLKMDITNYNSNLTIDENGIVRAKSLISNYGNILQGEKSSGGNAFGDTVRIGSYDNQPMRFYAGNTPGVTIKPTGTATFVPLDSNTILLRNIAYNESSKVSEYLNGVERHSVSRGAFPNVVDGNRNTDFTITSNSWFVDAVPQILGFKVTLNGYYYIDSVVIISNVGNVAGRWITVINNGAEVDNNFISGSGNTYLRKMNGRLGNEVALNYRPKSFNNGNDNVSCSEIYIYGRRAKAIPSGLSETRVNGTLAMDNVSMGNATDSILTINTAGQVRRIAPTTIKSSIDTSIYSFDGSLKGNRTVTMNNNNLLFNSGNGNFIFNTTGTGKVGIATTTPSRSLEVNKGIISDSLTLVGSNNMLKLVKGVAGNSPLFMEFFKNGTSSSNYGTRSGYFGFGSSNANDMYIRNELSGGSLQLGSIANPLSLVIDSLSRIVTQYINGNGDTILPALKIEHIGNISETSRYTGLMLSMRTGKAGAKNSITFRGTDINGNAPVDVGAIWSNVGSSYNSPSIGFSLNNNKTGLADVMVLNSNGNVGIGTTNPIQKLDVSGTIKSEKLYLNDLETGANSDKILVIGNDKFVRTVSAVTGKNIYDTDGTLNSDRTVTMANKSLTFYGENLVIFDGEIARDMGVTFGTRGTKYWDVVKLTNLDFAIRESGIDNRIKIKRGGNVGIGTDNPTQKLDVDGGSIFRGTLQASNIVMNAIANQGNISNLRTLFGTNSLSFSGNNIAIHMLITNNGNVGIGTNTPAQLLDIQKSGGDNYIRLQAGATIANSAGILFNEHNNDYGWRMRFDAGNDNFYLEAISGATIERTPFFINRASGNIGIGNTTPAYPLDVNGDIRTSNVLFATRIQGTSDARLKKDISPIKGALEKVLQLQGVTYHWRKDKEQETGYHFKEGKDYGVIAQDIQKIFPELVQQDAKGYLTVDYIHITPILIESVKELKQEIEELKYLLKQQLGTK